MTKNDGLKDGLKLGVSKDDVYHAEPISRHKAAGHEVIRYSPMTMNAIHGITTITAVRMKTTMTT